MTAATWAQFAILAVNGLTLLAVVMNYRLAKRIHKLAQEQRDRQILSTTPISSKVSFLSGEQRDALKSMIRRTQESNEWLARRGA